MQKHSASFLDVIVFIEIFTAPAAVNCFTNYQHGAVVFFVSQINRLQIDRSREFANPRLYDTYCQFLLLYWKYLCIYVYVRLFCICDMIRLTSTFPCHRLDQYIHCPNTSAIHRHLHDKYLNHNHYKMKIYIEGLKVLCPHSELHS